VGGNCGSWSSVSSTAKLDNKYFYVCCCSALACAYDNSNSCHKTNNSNIISLPFRIYKNEWIYNSDTVTTSNRFTLPHEILHFRTSSACPGWRMLLNARSVRIVKRQLLSGRTTNWSLATAHGLRQNPCCELQGYKLSSSKELTNLADGNDLFGVYSDFVITVDLGVVKKWFDDKKNMKALNLLHLIPSSIHKIKTTDF
jgi:hypothetical protein